MIQQESYLKVADNTGAKEIKTCLLYTSLGDPKIGHQDIVRTLHRQNSFPREEGLFRVRTEHIAFCGVRQFSRRKFYEMFINREEAGPR